jgi:adenosylcobyric acid synthase
MAALMIQGCGSDVGKSVLTAGLCRLFADRGLRVRPFKPQNMSNNAAVTADGGEIGRAQALQAIACRVDPSIHMNPVLLKPSSDVEAQVVIQGKVAGLFEAGAYQSRKESLLGVALESFRRLEAEADLVLVEGAGSPAETNLRRGDIANMGFAAAANIPVVLVGDIDRGHVIAQLAGAHAVLDAADRARIKGFIINKFRGDPRLFDDGRSEIVRRTGWPDLGLAPWLAAARSLPAEDAVMLDCPERARDRIRIVALMLPRIANFDDFDPLRAEPEVEFSYLPPGQALPGDVDLLIIPGTKATLADLSFLRAQGWDVDVRAHVRRGGRVLGICGGYQMLGRRIADPEGLEGPPEAAEGLGLLEVETVLQAQKVLRPISGRLADGAAFDGYEIHAGRTVGPGAQRPFLRFADGTSDGAVSPNGRVAGAYVHGLFSRADARAALLRPLGAIATTVDHHTRVDAALTEIASALAEALDIEALERLAGLPLGASRPAPI